MSFYYSKTVCELCYNDKCSHSRERNIHMDGKKNKCKSFIDEKLYSWKKKIEEQQTNDEYSMYDGVW